VKPKIKRFLAAIVAASAFACAHGGEPDIATLASNSDQVIWEAAQKSAEKKNWEAARQAYKRIIEGFPQSEFGPAARLALADSYFQEGGTGSYILAVAQYRDFLTLYPSHPRSDYAQLQVAESYFKQKNSPDRDQTPTERALEEFVRLRDIYPQSQYLGRAKERIDECLRNLAEAEFRVGYFYQRTRQAHRSAIGRYEAILARYPEFDRLDEVLFRLAECLSISGRAPEARPHLARLLEKYPQSSFADSARKLMSDLERSAPGTPPATSPPASSSPAPPSPVPPSPGAPA
jgi:outer membrane protein assembly factor BamD